MTTLSKELTPVQQALIKDLKEAEHKAWDALGRYKFQMFGYWAAIWVHLNRVGGFKEPNPWSGLVKIADKSPKAKQAKQVYEVYK